MSIPHTSRIRYLAMVMLVSASVATPPSAAGTDSPATPTEGERVAHPPKGRIAVCTAIDRPKYTIRQCACSPNALSGIASVDAAEILRLLTRDHGCRSPTTP